MDTETSAPAKGDDVVFDVHGRPVQLAPECANQLVDAVGLARLLAMHPNTIYGQLKKGTAPKHMRVGVKIRFRIGDILSD
ncbi:MAG: hypothetical protein U1E45_16530 [Geminicoccaceae bacterium]